MTELRIQCPWCHGKGEFWQADWNCGGEGSMTKCGPCSTSGTISDRRKDVTVPADQWRNLAELAAAWNSGDCCAAIADDMAGIIAKIGGKHD